MFGDISFAKAILGVSDLLFTFVDFKLAKSFLIIRPRGPVPLIKLISIRSFSAIRRARGEIKMRSTDLEFELFLVCSACISLVCSFCVIGTTCSLTFF